MDESKHEANLIEKETECYSSNLSAVSSKFFAPSYLRKSKDDIVASKQLCICFISKKYFSQKSKTKKPRQKDAISKYIGNNKSCSINEDVASIKEEVLKDFFRPQNNHFQDVFYANENSFKNIERQPSKVLSTAIEKRKKHYDKSFFINHLKYNPRDRDAFLYALTQLERGCSEENEVEIIRRQNAQKKPRTVTVCNRCHRVAQVLDQSVQCDERNCSVRCKRSPPKSNSKPKTKKNPRFCFEGNCKNKHCCNRANACRPIEIACENELTESDILPPNETDCTPQSDSVIMPPSDCDIPPSDCEIPPSVWEMPSSDCDSIILPINDSDSMPPSDVDIILGCTPLSKPPPSQQRTTVPPRYPPPNYSTQQQYGSQMQYNALPQQSYPPQQGPPSQQGPPLQQGPPPQQVPPRQQGSPTQQGPPSQQAGPMEYNSQQQYNVQQQYDSQQQYNSQPQFNSQPQCNLQQPYDSQQQYNSRQQYDSQPQYDSQEQYRSQPPYDSQEQYRAQPQYNIQQQGPPSQQGPPQQGPPQQGPPQQVPPQQGPPQQGPPQQGPPQQGPPQQGPPQQESPPDFPPFNGPPQNALRCMTGGRQPCQRQIPQCQPRPQCTPKPQCAPKPQCTPKPKCPIIPFDEFVSPFLDDLSFLKCVDCSKFQEPPSTCESQVTTTCPTDSGLENCSPTDCSQDTQDCFDFICDFQCKELPTLDCVPEPPPKPKRPPLCPPQEEPERCCDPKLCNMSLCDVMEHNRVILLYKSKHFPNPRRPPGSISSEGGFDPCAQLGMPTPMIGPPTNMNNAGDPCAMWSPQNFYGQQQGMGQCGQMPNITNVNCFRNAQTQFNQNFGGGGMMPQAGGQFQPQSFQNQAAGIQTAQNCCNVINPQMMRFPPQLNQYRMMQLPPSRPHPFQCSGRCAGPPSSASSSKSSKDEDKKKKKNKKNKDKDKGKDKDKDKDKDKKNDKKDKKDKKKDKKDKKKK